MKGIACSDGPKIIRLFTKRILPLHWKPRVTGLNSTGNEYFFLTYCMHMVIAVSVSWIGFLLWKRILCCLVLLRWLIPFFFISHFFQLPFYVELFFTSFFVQQVDEDRCEHMSTEGVLEILHKSSGVVSELEIHFLSSCGWGTHQ